MSSTEQPSVETDNRRRFSIIHGGHAPTDSGDSTHHAGADVDHDDPEETDGRASDRTGESSGDRDEVSAGVVRQTDGAHSVQTNESRGERDGDTGAQEQVDPAVTSSNDLVDDPGAEVDGEYLEARDAIAEQARAVLVDADPVAYYRSLRSLVRDSHSSVLGPLDYSFDLSFHHPAEVVVPVAVSNVETALLYARAAFPDFDDVILAAFTDPSRSDLLVSLYDMLFIEGRNVALVTNHGQIIDIALVVAALFVAMTEEGRTFGVLGEATTVEDLGDRFNTLVSRMVATRQAFGIPALQVTHHISRVFLSLPQTASRRRSKIDPTLVRSNNALMRYELENQLARGGQLLAMAASGSQDLTIPQLMSKARAAWRSRRGDDPGEEPTLHLQPLYNGTVTLMRSCDYVLPVAVSLDSRCPAVVVGSLTRLHDDDDCHRVMDWIALAHQEATGIPTIYHQPGDDLLTQVRGLINR